MRLAVEKGVYIPSLSRDSRLTRLEEELSLDILTSFTVCLTLSFLFGRSFGVGLKGDILVTGGEEGGVSSLQFDGDEESNEALELGLEVCIAEEK
jgi:hypothetical protein